MSWISIKTSGGRLKIKPRWQLRWAERMHRVRVIDLGLLVISWWSRDDLDKY
ncbi:MAG: hypothetical protein ACOH2L_13560 [Devosia sp.]